jgi:hypothetical protein
LFSRGFAGGEGKEKRAMRSMFLGAAFFTAVLAVHGPAAGETPAARTTATGRPVPATTAVTVLQMW